MTVACRMTQCPYYSNNFCGKPLAVTIDQMGMCSVLWRKGQRVPLKTPFTDQYYPRQSVEIIDAEIVVDDSQETKIKKKGESRSEDPLNGDAAFEQTTEKTTDEKDPSV